MLYDRPAVAGRVFRHGRLRQTELVGVLQSCDIFCLPSLYEGMSLAVLEGMACGLDAIVSPVAGYSEDASPALSLASGVADFAEHLSSVSACRLAVPIAAQLRAREFARGFSWWAYGDRLSRLLGLELGRQR